MTFRKVMKQMVTDCLNVLEAVYCLCNQVNNTVHFFLFFLLLINNIIIISINIFMFVCYV